MNQKPYMMTSSQRHKMDQNILVIKLSALGDFVQNLGLMRAIREHHKEEKKITLLTTKPYVELGNNCSYFDNIIIDERPKILEIKKWSTLRKNLKSGMFNIIYDLQNNDRSRLYHSSFLKHAQYIGLKKNTNKDNLAFYRHKAMLEQAGLSDIKIDAMEWMTSNAPQFILPEKYALIVPGCAPKRPEKRWPEKNYSALCQHLTSQGITPVILGTKDEEDITDEIVKACPTAINLNGKTKLTDIPDLARSAIIAIGNDTGPMHMIGPTGCKTLALFSGYSAPNQHKPIGDNVHTLQKKELEHLSIKNVIEKIESMILS